MVIIFENEKTRKQLMDNGQVFTFRRIVRETGKDWATDKHGGQKLCDVHVNFAAEVQHPLDLLPFIKKSGFSTVAEWMDDIELLEKPKGIIENDKVSGYIYYVVRVD